jgi:DNA ligase (NAD+)
MPETSKPVGQLTASEATEELAALSAEIAEHDRRYHAEDAPTISDADYDALRRRNAEIELRFPELVRSDSPTEKVGAAPSGAFAQVRHSVPMLSLDNTFSDEDVADFVASVRRFLNWPADQELVFTAEPKIDGLSLSLRYERRPLVTAATRGDGEVARMSPPTPAPSPTSRRTGRRRCARGRRGARRGLHEPRRLRRAERAGREGRQDLRQPAQRRRRQLRQLDPASPPPGRCASSPTAWGELSEPLATTQNDAILRRVWGIPDQSPDCCSATGGDALLAHYRMIEAQRATLGYDIDGVVYKVNDLALQARLGFRSSQPPLGDRAQVPGELAWTRLRHRHPGRPHRRADAGGAAGAGHGRRRGGQQCHAAQRGLHRRASAAASRSARAATSASATGCRSSAPAT